MARFLGLHPISSIKPPQTMENFPGIPDRPPTQGLLAGLMAGLRGPGGAEHRFAKAHAAIRIQLPGGEFVGMLRVWAERRRPRHSPAAPERLPAGGDPRGGGAERFPWPHLNIVLSAWTGCAATLVDMCSVGCFEGNKIIEGWEGRGFDERN